MTRLAPADPVQATPRPREARASSHASGAAAVGASLCLFSLAGAVFALDVSCIGEVVQIDRIVPVPMAPSTVLGLVNLRGVPLEILDPGLLLDLPVAGAARSTVLVLNLGSITAGVLVDRVEQVVAWERIRLLPRADDDHPMVAGLVETGLVGTHLATLLDPVWIAARLEAMRMSKTHADTI